MAVIRLTHNNSVEAAQAAAEGMQTVELRRQVVRLQIENSRTSARLQVAENTIRRLQGQLAARYAGARVKRDAEYAYRKTLCGVGFALGVLSTSLVFSVALWLIWR